ncbi:MAG: thermonuclease family protein [Proteobacteria bacterium]|nr:thermonuclease family protein [Pseudomonadota bacterium]
MNGKRATIRLAQIDTPETDQPWGKNARRALAKKLSRRTVQIEVVDVDNYGRLIATVFVNGENVNRQLVQEGHAWAYRQYLHDRSLLKDERSARQEHLGLWQATDPIPPWDWRRRVSKSR